MAASTEVEDVPARRPVTRSLLQTGLVSSSVPAKKTKAKKVKFVEPDSSAGLHNSSVTTDEGIDLSFSSPGGSNSVKIPANIARPHHSLAQPWTFWFSGNNKRDSWTQDLVSVANMKTVEEFWTIYNQVCLSPAYRFLWFSTHLFPGAALQSPAGRPVLLRLQGRRGPGLGGSRQQGRGPLAAQLQHRGEEGLAGPAVAGGSHLRPGGQDGQPGHR